MPVLIDFALSSEDGTLTISMNPPVPIGGWSILFQMTKRLGGSAIITKSCASGFINVSGMTILDSGQGRMQVQLTAAEMSGQDWGNYSYLVQRQGSGVVTNLSEGYRLYTP